jgi:hypothetical protein
MGLVGRGFRPHRAFVIIPVSLTPNSLFARAELWSAVPQRGTALQSSAPNARREAFFRNL